MQHTRISQRSTPSTGRRTAVGFWLAAAIGLAAVPSSTCRAEGPIREQAATSAAAQRAGDWPMMGGAPDRNMVSDERGLPVKWDVVKKQNIKWVAKLGSQTFGNPVIGGGKVFIGTNNGAKRDPKASGDKGVMMCFAESDGTFLWQAVHDKLPNQTAHDWPEIGVCSAPCVVGDRLYYVSNRCELICLDTEGFRDNENDGPIKDEKLNERTDADVVWTLDMVKALGVLPHQAVASSPLVVGDLVFVVTGNGIDEDREKVPAPSSPSFIAVNRASGKVAWADSSPGGKILEGQWSSPAFHEVQGKPQIVFPGGDGWLYAFEPTTGKRLWKFDCKLNKPDPESTDIQNHLVATPVCHDDKVFVAVGQNPENGAGPGCLWAIDASKTGDATQTGKVWHYGGKAFGRSMSTVAIRDGLLYAAELDGYLHCLDVATGKRLWRHDLEAPVWASPLVIDGKVYVGNEDGDITVFKHDRHAKVLATNAMDETVYGTAVAANGVLYIGTRTQLYAIARSPTTSAQSPKPPARSAKPLASRGAIAASPDWPMFRGNAQLTGATGTTLPSALRVCWEFEAPDAVESTPAIVGDAVFFGCDDGILYALALANGAVRWRYPTGAMIRSSPTVRAGVIFFGDDLGVFHGVDARTGKVRWTFKAESEIISSANVTGGRVLFGSYDNYLYCLAQADGALVWKHETEDKVHGTPAVIGDRALVAGCDSQLRAVRISDGSAAGTVDMGSFSGASVAVQGPRAYVGTMGNQVLAVDWENRKIAWKYEHPQRHQPFYASAAVANDLVIVGGRDKLVHALDSKTGKPRWTFATKGRIDASPTIVGGRVFVGSMDGNLYGLELATGKLVWRFDAGSPFVASPAAGRGRLVVGTEDGVIYCFGAGSAADE